MVSSRFSSINPAQVGGSGLGPCAPALVPIYFWQASVALEILPKLPFSVRAITIVRMPRRAVTRV